MSSGSTTQSRRPNAAASTPQLVKDSSRFVNGQAAGAGAGSKPSSAMKRQRQGDGGALDAESNSDQSNAKPSKKRFVGVRQRPSGRWVAEIKDTTQKIRLWLGTFDSAEEGAKAYDSAARALRGANTRTNFVPAMACEGASAPASKAARLIRLRQMAAAAKASKSDSQGADHSIPKVEPPEVIDSPAVVRPDLQQSISSSTSSLEPLIPSPASDDAPLQHAAASPPKPPPRLVDRRHNVLASPQPDSQDEDHDDGALPFAAIHDHGTVDNGSPKIDVIPSKLEPQQSVTFESLSDASCSPPLNFPSPRSHFECVHPVNSHVEPLQHKEPSFTVKTLVEASRSSFSHHHHPLSSCATNRGMYPSEVKCAPEMDTGQTSAFIMREEFAEMDQVPDIPWPEYTLESGMLPGLDESSGVYTSAFDFSAEAIDRDSCTSVMLDHVEHDPHDEFLMHYERTPSHEVDHDQCVLLKPLDSISSSCQPHHVWRSMDVDGCWDGQSSGSTEEVPGGVGGECMSSQQDPDICDIGDHDVWTSMDLPPLCMVA